ncbi:serine protease [Jannaschia sp. LMIT008]|uniref:serine protease n=1 Tax=Jannaschia maritima TaxID=3032585 RepID=UPI002810EEF0|nr:serine protease [Jannaschia sp. LMIT008]
MRVVVICLAVLWGGVAWAQDAFVQIEAHPSRAEAVDRAQAYANLFDDVAAFRQGSRWHVVALGPYPDPPLARARLRALRGQGLIPRDSFVSDVSDYGERVWPEGGGPLFAPAPSPGPEVASAPAPEVAAPEETLRQAQRSERALSRPEKQDLQRALRWFGHYAAAIDGSFGRGTRGAMIGWQASQGLPQTGVLTTRQRAALLGAWRAERAALGLAPVTVAEAGLTLTLPEGLVAFDRIAAPFVHYGERDGSGVTLSLISQAGGRDALAGLYQIIQTLDAMPPAGPRDRSPAEFRIRGEGARTAHAFARADGDHVVGFLLSWGPDAARAAERAVAAMEETIASTGAPLPSDAGFDADAQAIDRVSGLEVRQPLRSGTGFWITADGRILTSSALAGFCTRLTIGDGIEARSIMEGDGIAVLEPRAIIAPRAVAAIGDRPPRLGDRLAVAGFPFDGLLGQATLTFGTLEDIRALDGTDGTLRLSLEARDGDRGGPVLDRAGRVVGMLAPDTGDRGQVLPFDAAFAIDGRRLLRAVETFGRDAVPADRDLAPLPPERLVDRAADLAVLVQCWEE